MTQAMRLCWKALSVKQRVMLLLLPYLALFFVPLSLPAVLIFSPVGFLLGVCLSQAYENYTRPPFGIKA